MAIGGIGGFGSGPAFPGQQTGPAASSGPTADNKFNEVLLDKVLDIDGFAAKAGRTDIIAAMNPTAQQAIVGDGLPQGVNARLSADVQTSDEEHFTADKIGIDAEIVPASLYGSTVLSLPPTTYNANTTAALQNNGYPTPSASPFGPQLGNQGPNGQPSPLQLGAPAYPQTGAPPYNSSPYGGGPMSPGMPGMSPPPSPAFGPASGPPGAYPPGPPGAGPPGGSPPGPPGAGPPNGNQGV